MLMYSSTNLQIHHLKRRVCLLRRTETNTTAQRPYQGGFTIRNKLNNVSQISKEVLKFVGKL